MVKTSITFSTRTKKNLNTKNNFYNNIYDEVIFHCLKKRNFLILFSRDYIYCEFENGIEMDNISLVRDYKVCCLPLDGFEL